MPVTTYTTIDGEIVSQDVNGTVHDLLPDPLGHTVGLIGSGQGIEFEYAYWPYEEVGSIDDVATALRYVGTLGYYSDDYGSPRVYVRARHYRGPYGRWLTIDPLWPNEIPYGYAQSSPVIHVDPSGTHPCDDRTVSYCGAAAKSGSIGLKCICEAQKALCTLIKLKEIPQGIRAWLDCMNRSIHRCWLHQEGPLWARAKRECDTCPESLACCAATGRAEQHCFTLAKAKCKGVGTPPPFPRPWNSYFSAFPIGFMDSEKDRALAFAKHCCLGDKTTSVADSVPSQG